MQSSNGKYSLNMRIIHWLMAVMIISIIACGFFMTWLDPKLYPFKYQIYDLHKSFGLIVLLLLIIRLVVRLASLLPPALTQFSMTIRVLGNITHLLLYLFMLAMPVSGYLASSFSDRPVALFGLKIPNLVWTDKSLGHLINEWHSTLAFIFIGVISLHLLAALKHRYIDKQDILPRMW